MASLTDYRGLQVITPDPSGAGGLALNNDLKELADRAGPVFSVAADPDANDDSADTNGNGKAYAWSKWINSAAGTIWICRDATPTAAIWEQIDNAGGLANVVEDTTPQLGGNLDANGFNIEGVTPTEMGYVSGVTSDIQTQINSKGTLSNIVEDTTPQLGGDLDVLARTITTSTTNGNIDFGNNGTGGWTFGATHTNTGTRSMLVGASHSNSGSQCVISGDNNTNNSGQRCSISGYYNSDNSGDDCLISGGTGFLGGNSSNSGDSCLITGKKNTSNSGNFCSLSGYYNNDNSGASCSISGYYNGPNTGNYCSISGFSNASNSGASCLIAGNGNSTNSGDTCLIAGTANSGNTGASCLIAGSSNSGNTGSFAVLTGSQCANTLYGARVHASGRFTANGDAQHIMLVARKSVTHSDATWTALTLDGAAAGATNRLNIATDTVWNFVTRIVGTTNGCSKSFGFTITGVIENDGGTTSILASAVTTNYDADDTDFDARVTADDTNDALLIEVSDSTSGGDVVLWVATVDITSVTNVETI